MPKTIVIIGDQGGHVTAALAAVIALKNANNSHEVAGEVDPFTEHQNRRSSGHVLDQQSFDPIPEDQKQMEIVLRRPDGAQDTLDA